MEAFGNDLNTAFYPCNTGTAGQNSFAQLWVNRFGGLITAFQGKTDYTNCADTSFDAFIVRNLIELFYGVSAFGGSPKLPVAGTDAIQLEFTEECIDE